MQKTHIKIRKGVKLNKSVLIVGLPGIGNVGRLIAKHLIKEFDAEIIAVLYSPHFPHHVIMLKNGGVRLVSNRFYLLKQKTKAGNSIIVLTGDFQALTPWGQYEVNEGIVNFFRKRLKGEFIYTLGGYYTGTPAKEPKVFGNATSAKVINNFKNSGVIFGESKGAILGSAGLVIAFAKMRGVDGICIMGESSSQLDPDAAAAKAVLKILSDRLQLSIDTSKIDSLIEAEAKALRALEQQFMNLQIPIGQELEQPESGKLSYIR